jgi:hypothetical protein
MAVGSLSSITDLLFSTKRYPSNAWLSPTTWDSKQHLLDGFQTLRLPARLRRAV